MKELYKKIPQVSKLIQDEEITKFFSEFIRGEVKEEIENSLNEIRKKIKEKKITDLSYGYVKRDIVNRLSSKNKYSLRRVINGTGTIVHTNLGRSLLCDEAIKNVTEVCCRYNNLEYDIDNGKRGSRYSHLEDMVAKIIGCESAMVVNNNAAATMLCVAAFATDKEVVVSRGELVEIGGSFRIPEIIEVSNAILKEVGTTNRTHVKDYRNATNENTSMYLKVHPSNYRILGFTKTVTNNEIVKLAREVNQNREDKIVTLEDLGSGVLIDFEKHNFIKENTVKESLESGIDLVTFSGDKLLGGPQAGVIVGKKEFIEVIKKHPLCRAFRVGKMTIAALEATLRLYFDDNTAISKIPTLNMIFKDQKVLLNEARKLSDEINSFTNFNSSVIEVQSTVGGGSLPLSEISSYGVTINRDNFSLQEIDKLLREYKIPIVSRVFNDNLYIDVITLLNGDRDVIVNALKGF